MVDRINEPSVTAMGLAGRLGSINPGTPKLTEKPVSSKFSVIFISTDKHMAGRPEISNAYT